MKKDLKGFGFALIRIGLAAAVVALIAVLVMGFRANSSRYTRNIDYKDLDPLMGTGQTLPEGEFGKLTVRWVLGSYAEEKDNIGFWGIPFKSGEYQYYLAIAPDLSLITIRTGDRAEIAQLESLADQFASVSSEKDLNAIPGYQAKGKIGKLRDKEVKDLYEEAWDDIGFGPGSGVTRSDLMIDTGALPDGNVLLYIVLPIVGLVILATSAAVLIRRRKKAAGKAGTAPGEAAEGLGTAPAEAAETSGTMPAEAADGTDPTVPRTASGEDIPEEYRRGTDL